MKKLKIISRSRLTLEKKKYEKMMEGWKFCSLKKKFLRWVLKLKK